jgi:hypothetical protein
MSMPWACYEEPDFDKTMRQNILLTKAPLHLV